jgi:DNA-binding NtrC family response regulator
MKKILVVDDDAEFRSNLIEVLKGAGYETESVSSAKAAMDLAGVQDFDIVLLDFMMPKMNGIDTLIALRKSMPKTRVIMITAFSSIENAVVAIKKGASDYVSKPFKIDELLTTIRRVLEEAKFEENMERMDFDHTLSSLANPIRRSILKLLRSRDEMRLMEITRELGIDDHTKVVFHLKILKEAGSIEQNVNKSYFLTAAGMKTIDCLKTMENTCLS